MRLRTFYIFSKFKILYAPKITNLFRVWPAGKDWSGGWLRSPTGATISWFYMVSLDNPDLSSIQYWCTFLEAPMCSFDKAKKDSFLFI